MSETNIPSEIRQAIIDEAEKWDTQRAAFVSGAMYRQPEIEGLKERINHWAGLFGGVNKKVIDLEKENKALKVQNSAMKTHYEAGKKITEHSLKKANEAKSAVETVDSEREMNAILTNEITALQSSLKEKDQEIERLKQNHADWLEATERGDKLFQSHHKKELEELKAENEVLKSAFYDRVKVIEIQLEDKEKLLAENERLRLLIPREPTKPELTP